jgi:ArsR family transcriptional regulator
VEIRPFPEDQKILCRFLVDVTMILVMIKVVMNDVVQFSRALADQTRWRIIRLVLRDALCVCELADILEMPQSSVSSHVQVIRKAGLLESEKCEKWTYFQINRSHRKLIELLAKTFSDEDDEVAKSDSARARERLARRENSCCPGPKNLQVRKY